MANIKGIIVEIGGDTSALENSLKKVKSSTASLNKELRGINSLLKIDPKNTELVSQKQKVLNENIKETEAYLNNVKEAQQRYIDSGGDLNTAEYRNLQREIINTENKLKNMQVEASNWTQAGRSIEEFGNKVKNISTKVGDIGTNLTTKLTLPIVGATTAVVKAFDEVDKGADTVIKKTGATGESAQELESIYKKVSTSVAGDFEDIGSAVGEINTRFGFTGNALEEASEKFLKFAKINDVDVNTAVQKVSRYMGDAGIEANKYGTILDQLSSVAQASGISIDSLTEMLTKYGAPMRALGLETEECIAIFAGWEKAGVNTEIAFSGMKKAIGTWGKQGKDSTEEFKKTLEEIKRCPDIASATTKAIEVFGQKAGPDLADAIKGGRFEYSQFLDIVKSSEGTLEGTYDEVIDEADEAQIAMKELKVQLSEVGAEALKTVVPAFKSMLKGAGDLILKYNKLSDSEKKQVNNMILFVASIGPAIKIIGTLGKGIGTVTSGIGIFAQAIGVAKNNATSSVTSVNNLANALNLLTSPVGMLTTAFALAGAAVYAYDQKVMSGANTILKEREAIQGQIEDRERLMETQQKQVDSNLIEIGKTEELWNELKKITDENGKVKDGYKNRAEYITGELSKALGIEIGLNGDQIDKYKELRGEIDKTIQKKKAEIYLQSEEETYKQALEGRKEGQKKLNELQQQYNDELKKSTYNGNDFWKAWEAQGAKQKVAQLGQAMKEQSDLLNTYSQDIQKYEYDYQLMQTNTADSLQELINRNEQGYTTDTTNLKTNLDSQMSMIQSKLEYDKQKQAESISNLSGYLTTTTTTISDLTPEQVDKWSYLANTSYDKYQEALSKIPPETANEVQKAVNTVAGNKTLASESGSLASDASGSYGGNIQGISTSTSSAVSGAEQAVDQSNLSTKFSTKASDSNSKFSDYINYSKGKSATDDYFDGANGGILAKIGSFLKKLFNAGQQGNQSFRSGMGDGSPSVLAKRALIDYFLGADKGLNKQAPKTIKKVGEYGSKINSEFANSLNFPSIQNFDNLQGSLKNKIFDRTNTILTTPNVTFNVQKMTDSELDRAFNYIDKKYGSKIPVKGVKTW